MSQHHGSLCEPLRRGRLAQRAWSAPHRRCGRPASSLRPCLRPCYKAAGSLVQECSEEDWQQPFQTQDTVVALGKFDALHVGHRSLAEAAALTGSPALLTFSGMAQVLGWAPQLPLVAPCDRARVLHSWVPHCCGRTPSLRSLPFRLLRHLQPEEFVALLAQDLRAVGVVAGANYRFGYRAMGDAAMLQSLGRQHGLHVTIVDLLTTQGHESATHAQDTAPHHCCASLSSVAGSCCGSHGPPPPEQRVSSSRVRELLARGEVRTVHSLLGRPYRLVLALPHPPSPPAAVAPCISPACTSQAEATVNNVIAPMVPFASGFALTAADTHGGVLLPLASCLNQPPAPGSYAALLSAQHPTTRDVDTAAPTWQLPGMDSCCSSSAAPAASGGLWPAGPRLSPAPDASPAQHCQTVGSRSPARHGQDRNSAGVVCLASPGERLVTSCLPEQAACSRRSATHSHSSYGAGAACLEVVVKVLPHGVVLPHSSQQLLEAWQQQAGGQGARGVSLSPTLVALDLMTCLDTDLQGCGTL